MMKKMLERIDLTVIVGLIGIILCGILMINNFKMEKEYHNTSIYEFFEEDGCSHEEMMDLLDEINLGDS